MKHIDKRNGNFDLGYVPATPYWWEPRSSKPCVCGCFCDIWVLFPFFKYRTISPFIIDLVTSVYVYSQLLVYRQKRFIRNCGQRTYKVIQSNLLKHPFDVVNLYCFLNYKSSPSMIYNRVFLPLQMKEK